MQTKRNFYFSVVEVVEKRIKEINDTKAEIQKLEKMNASGVYSDKRMKENEIKIKELRNNLDTVRIYGKQEVTELCEKYASELSAEDALKGSELTEDAKLLNSGIKLNKRDYEAMLERNKGNRTMTQLIYRSAEEAGLKMGNYTGNSATISALRSVPYTAEVCMKWADKQNVFNQLLGEGSAMETWANN